MPGRRPRRAIQVVALAATVAGLGGCGGVAQDGPLRGLAQSEQVGVVVRDADRFPTWHFGSFVVCLEEDGPVTIDGVDATTVGDVDVVAVGARTTSDELAGAMPGPMPENYSPAAGFQVEEACGPNGGAELVLELQVPESGSSAVDGFTIRYSQDGAAYEVGYAAQILLCRGEDTSSDEEVLAACGEGTG